LFYYVFYPQFMCLIFLYPDSTADYGFLDGFDVIGWPRYLKWLAGGYPASFVYGVVFIEAWRYIRQWRHDGKDAK
jgi:hypothetical protein